MNTKLLIGGAVIVALIALAYFLSPRASAPSPEEATGADAQIVEESTEPLTSEAEDAEVTTDAANTADTAPTQSTPSTNTGGGATSQPAPKPIATPTPALTYPTNVTVVYDGGRFIPDEVVIIEGGTVRFVNISDIDMWIASNNHPTHTLYPIKDEDACNGNTFDQCAAVEKGGSWSFSFKRTGTWPYHNHERAKDTAKVVVLTKEEFDKRR